MDSRQEFKCDGCSQVFETEFELLLHRTFYHKLGTVIPCPKCNETFTDPKMIALHINSHSNIDLAFLKLFTPQKMQEISSGVKKTPAFRSMFRCVECGKSFGSNELLKRHFIEKMKEKSVHNCPFCVCTFILHKNLLQHQAMYHKADNNGSKSLEKPNSVFEFNTTDNETVTLEPMNKKSDGNHESNTICSLEQIRSKSMAKSTLTSIITKPYPFFCKWCSKRFRYKSSLRRHEIFNCKIIRKDLVLRRRNGSRSQVSARTTITRSLSRKDEELVYVSTKTGMPKPPEHILCHRCNVIFKKMKYLKNHNLRFHKNEKPVKELKSSNTPLSINIAKEKDPKGIRKNHKTELLNKYPEVKCRETPQQTMLNNKPLGRAINEPYVVVNVPTIHVTKIKETATEKNCIVPNHSSTSRKLVHSSNCRLKNRTLTNDHADKKKSRLGETITNINNHQSDTSKVLGILNKANDRDIDPKLTKQPVLKPVVCDKCMRSFTSKIGLRKHLRLFCKGHHTASFTKCFMCKQSFESRARFYSHLKAFHNVKNLTVQQMEKMIPKNWNSNAASSILSEAEDKSTEGGFLSSVHEDKPVTNRGPPSNIQSRSGSRWTFETLSEEQETNLIDQHETCSVEVNVHRP